MEQHQVKIGKFEIGNKLPLALIAGPCQIQSRQHAVELAGKLVELTSKLGINYIFKASFDKANRTSITGARGVGIEEGIRTFDEIKKLYGCYVNRYNEITPLVKLLEQTGRVTVTVEGKTIKIFTNH